MPRSRSSSASSSGTARGNATAGGTRRSTSPRGARWPARPGRRRSAGLAPSRPVGSSTYGATGSRPPLSPEQLRLIDAYWRAANYLSVGQIYLYDNPLLREPLTLRHIKPRLLGHFGTTPGLNLLYAHLNRVIKARDLSVLYVAGPGHGGPGIVANTYLEGTYSEIYPNVSQDEAGLKRLFTQFSFP